MSDHKPNSDYSEDGEISDESSNNKGGKQIQSDEDYDEPMPSPGVKPTRHAKSVTSSSEDDAHSAPGKEIESEMRNKLLSKMKTDKKFVPNPDNDEDEMFTIQPKDAVKAKDKLREAEKEKEREAERRKKSKDREREKREVSERDRLKREDRGDRRLKGRIEERYQKNRDFRRLPGRRERSPEKHKRKDDKKESRHKRKNSSSASEDDHRRAKESRKEAKREEKEHVKDDVVEIDEEKKSAKEEEEKVIIPFTLDSPAGPKKYSKFDSSPERSPTPMRDLSESPGPSAHNSGAEDEEIVLNDEQEAEEPVEEEEEPEEDNTKWEELTDEQKSFLDPDQKAKLEGDYQSRLIADLPVFYPGIMGCRNVAEFECVHKIDEGTYGVVYRAKDKRTDKIVALKRLKMEAEKEGFPITALREVNMLLKCGQHPNVVNVSEILIGSNMDKIFLAMEFVEHDMKKYMESMKKFHKKFTMGEVKTLMKQLLSGVEHMHKLWILHRDLKTSNLLITDSGILKIADFGLAREYGEPLKRFTPIVVTLWYRSPELLLGTEKYSTPVDLWSVGCIMGEFFTLKPIFDGRGEAEQVKKIYLNLGTPTEKIWEGVTKLKLFNTFSVGDYPYNQLRKMFPAHILNEQGFKLLNRFLTYNPANRITATEALADPWFTSDPLPVPPEELSTFPTRKAKKPPVNTQILNPETAELMKQLKVKPEHLKPSGFSLKF